MFDMFAQRGYLFRLVRSRMLLVLAGILLIAVAACSSSDDPIISEERDPNFPYFFAQVITTDMAVGKSRISFGIRSAEGMPIRTEEATVRSYFLVPNEDTRVLKSTVLAHFVPWPTNVAGIFEAILDFDLVGNWQLEVDFISPDGTAETAKSAFSVKEVSSTPPIGAPAPATVTPTAGDVEDLSHISSSPEPDPDLYQLSIHEALQQDKPLVVVFATPAFCVSATCGPQVVELAKVKDQYADQANFIHVEVFKDPHLIGGDQRPGLDDTVPAVTEWGLPTEPWTFVIDAQGLLRAKYEQFTPSDVIEAALLEAF